MQHPYLGTAVHDGVKCRVGAWRSVDLSANGLSYNPHYILHLLFAGRVVLYSDFVHVRSLLGGLVCVAWALYSTDLELFDTTQAQHLAAYW